MYGVALIHHLSGGGVDGHAPEPAQVGDAVTPSPLLFLLKIPTDPDVLVVEEYVDAILLYRHERADLKVCSTISHQNPP